MKTIKITSIIALSFLMSLGLFANTSIFETEEEACKNGITLSTTEVSVNCLYEMALAEEFEMEEETYIDDIPFNTECVSINCKYLKALNVKFDLPEETYIDDIPFNTKEIANNLH